MQEMHVVQVVVLQSGLALGPLQAGRDWRKNACRHAVLEKLGQGEVGVRDACGEGVQKLETERLSVLYVQVQA